MSDARVFGVGRWPLTLGVLMGVTLVAFENLAVITIAPRIASALGGEALYGWTFSAFLLASLLGSALGGAQADRYGPARPFALGLALFALGLLLAAFAPTMLVFILARAVQGLGGGLVITALYAAVNLAYDDALRVRVVALMSSAWVLPALLGPALAGLVAETLGWRVVFWGLVPLLALVALLALGAVARLRPVGAGRARPDLLWALVLVLGSGLFLAALGRLGWTLAPGLAAGALALLALGRLLPAGALRLEPGLPSVVAARGLFYAAFIGVETFLALMLSEVHGFSSSIAGLVIASGAISWTLASWLQDRLEARFGPAARHRRVRLGAALMGLGLAAQVLALYSPLMPLPLLPLAVTLGGWTLAGFGVGLAHSSSSVLAFARAPKGGEGRVSASLQLADQFGSALSTGAGGALFALALAQGLELRTGVLAAFGFNLLLAALALAAAGRIGPRES